MNKTAWSKYKWISPEYSATWMRKLPKPEANSVSARGSWSEPQHVELGPESQCHHPLDECSFNSHESSIFFIWAPLTIKVCISDLVRYQLHYWAAGWPTRQPDGLILMHWCHTRHEFIFALYSLQGMGKPAPNSDRRYRLCWLHTISSMVAFVSWHASFWSTKIQNHRRFCKFERDVPANIIFLSAWNVL